MSITAASKSARGRALAWSVRNHPLLKYRPLPTQRQFHSSRVNKRVLVGGNRSGKTHCGAAETAFRAIGIHPFQSGRFNDEPGLYLVVEPKLPQIAEIAWPKIRHYLREADIGEIKWQDRGANLPYSVNVRHRSGGMSRILFKASEQDAITFAGMAFDGVWFDEQFKPDVFIEATRGLIDRGGVCWITLTPVYPDAFLQRKFLDRPEGWEWFQMSLNENRRSRGGHLEDIHVDEMVRDWPAEIREVRVEGKFAGFQGAVWPMFSVRHIVRPFRIPASWQRYIFIDFGWTDPFVALWQARSPEGQWAVCHEYYQARRLYDEHADQIWQRGSKFWSPQECRAILADPEDLQGRQELARRGIHCQPFSKGKYSLMKGIDLLGTLMNDWRPALHGVDSPDGKMPAWVVFEGCDNAIREHASYQWSESSRRGLANSPNRDLPRMRDDHTCDANRGGIFTVERQMGNVPEDYRHVDAKAVRDDSGRPVKSLMRSRFISLEDKPVSGGAIWQLPSP